MLTPPTSMLQSRSIGLLSARLLTGVPGGHRTVRTLDIPARGSFEAFLSALKHLSADEPTRCAGWTVHELLAHLAAGSAEIADLATQALRGEPVRETRGFAEREAPFRELRPARLRRRFVVEAMRATASVLDLNRDDQALLFTGVDLSPTSLAAHAEAELVLHRWDMTGDDETSIGALSRPDVLQHTVKVVASMHPRVMPFQTRHVLAQRASAVLSADDQDDVILAVSLGSLELDVPVRAVAERLVG